MLCVLPAVASAASISWSKAVRIEAAKYGGLDAISCPNSGLCVAVDQSGNVVASTSPLKGAWTVFNVEPASYGGLTGVSCPTAALCVAVDQSGNVLTSTKPAAGARYWSKPVKIDTVGLDTGGTAGLTAISCPSVKLCVAVDDSPIGDVLTSTSPTGGATAWTTTKIGTLLDSVSCTYNTTDCVIAGTDHYWTATAIGTTAWHDTGSPAGGGVISSIACPSLSMCLGVGYGNSGPGLATTSATPRGDSTTWTTVSVSPDPPAPAQGVFDAVGCASARFCIALDGFDVAYTTTNPIAGKWGGGTAIRTKAAATSSAVSCNPKFCAVVDSAGVETTGVVS